MKERYVYDARGSVIQAVTGRATEYIAEAMKTPNVSLLNFTIQSYACTPFGEQMGAKISGYTHNAEAFDAATGMLNLRARQFDAALNQFAQKDAVAGSVRMPISLNCYAYCINDPITFVDPSGLQYCAVMLTDGGGGKTTDVNQVVSQMAQEALNDYKNGSIKKLADTVHYMQDNRNKLSAENITLLAETEAAIKNQRDTQMSLKGTKKERPAVREVSDYLAEMCSRITGDSFTQTYLTTDKTSASSSILVKKNDSILIGKNKKNVLMPIDYLPNAAKQMYLQGWDYPEDGRSGHYGIVSCTWLIAGGYRSFYKNFNSQSYIHIHTRVSDMFEDAIKTTNKLTGNKKAIMLSLEDSIPVSVAVFNEDKGHVGLTVGEIITYDLIYVEDAIIQATSGSANKHNGHGVMVTDARTGVVYFEYKEKGKRTI